MQILRGCILNAITRRAAFDGVKGDHDDASTDCIQIFGPRIRGKLPVLPQIFLMDIFGLRDAH